MAFVAAVDQDGPDVFLKEGRLIRRHLSRALAAASGEKDAEEADGSEFHRKGLRLASGFLAKARAASPTAGDPSLPLGSKNSR
jgi:hypothetical protein